MTSSAPPPYALPPPEPVATAAPPRMPEPEARNWAMAAHLSGLVGILAVVPGFVGPLVVWLMKKNEHPLIDANGKEALNFQLTMLVYFVVSFVLVLLLIGFLFLAILLIVAIVMPIIGGIQASDGRTYRYPATIRFIK